MSSVKWLIGIIEKEFPYLCLYHKQKVSLDSREDGAIQYFYESLIHTINAFSNHLFNPTCKQLQRVCHRVKSRVMVARSGQWWTVSASSTTTSCSVSAFFPVLLIVILFLWLFRICALIIICRWVSFTCRCIRSASPCSICTCWLLLLCWCVNCCLHGLLFVFDSVLK